MALLALRPMGTACFVWDAYLTPLISTGLLGLDDPSRVGWSIAVASLLVVGGAWLGSSGAAAG